MRSRGLEKGGRQRERETWHRWSDEMKSQSYRGKEH